MFQDIRRDCLNEEVDAASKAKTLEPSSLLHLSILSYKPSLPSPNKTAVYQVNNEKYSVADPERS